ncbi:patatin-like phospholipase family protein [Acidiphilium sp. C61]|jgi:NTE family protein|uniref:patatin-like phospholipase family protein n=1 Tax=Acidiphilium sp. C61 TaxID=1671485 RepID=UPI00157A594E|nr:patatin-like phospholipase family protein [Acidiphilium sp. C61]
MTNSRAPARPASYDKTIGLVLQGGGALGSYQAGVYEALASSDYLPDWVAGISIGAINAAIIAGNEPASRTRRLREFWDEITAPTSWWPIGLAGPLEQWQQRLGALAAIAFGQPGFFAPRDALDWLSTRPPLSYYETRNLRRTLERLVDFDRINTAGETRLSVGAVNIRTGRLVYFDSAEIAILPEHVMASGALPPGFPPVEIDGEYYWDGGLVSNTPLQYVLDYYPRRSRLTFQVDVFHGSGMLPDNLEAVAERQNDIRYSSRTRVATEMFQLRHEVRHAINELEKLLPPEILNTDQGRRLHAFGCVTEMDIAQLIYRPAAPQGAAKDYEFSRPTMNARWEQGLRDATTTLEAAPWLAPKASEVGVRVFDVMHDILGVRPDRGKG